MYVIPNKGAAVIGLTLYMKEESALSSPRTNGPSLREKLLFTDLSSSFISDSYGTYIKFLKRYICGSSNILVLSLSSYLQ